MMYRIWSIQHQAWWKPSRSGYCAYIKSAGLYTLEEAIEIVLDANIHVVDLLEPDEAIVPVPESEAAHGE